MIYNGLLKRYPHLLTKKGFLKTNNLGLNVRAIPFTPLDRQCLLQDGSSKFYIKFEKKSAIDSQLLMSQALLKFGIGSPVYLPAKDVNGRQGTISNDIESASCIQGVDLKSKLSEGGVILPSSRISIDRRYGIDYSTIFTKEGMRQLLKLNLFAAPTFLDDLTEENVFYSFDEHGKICGVSAIDFSGSRGVSSSTRSRYFSQSKQIDYVNNIGFQCDKTREQMAEELVCNPIVQQYLPTSEQVELIGSMAEDIGSIAKDIKQIIRYEINQQYVDKVSTSLSDFANELTQV